MKLRLIGKFIALLVHPRSQLNYGSLTTCMVDQMGTPDPTGKCSKTEG